MAARIGKTSRRRTNSNRDAAYLANITSRRAILKGSDERGLWFVQIRVEAQSCGTQLRRSGWASSKRKMRINGDSSISDTVNFGSVEIHFVRRSDGMELAAFD